MASKTIPEERVGRSKKYEMKAVQYPTYSELISIVEAHGPLPLTQIYEYLSCEADHDKLDYKLSKMSMMGLIKQNEVGEWYVR